MEVAINFEKYVGQVISKVISSVIGSLKRLGLTARLRFYAFNHILIALSLERTAISVRSRFALQKEVIFNVRYSIKL